jgi:hypothetical protein
MFAPSAFEATGPFARNASATSRVVVVLPLVAETSTHARPAASRRSSSGSSRSAIRPPTTAPEPRPAARETAPVSLPATTATLARGGSGASVIVTVPPNRSR